MTLAGYAFLYAGLVAMFLFLSTGLATLRYGDAFLPMRIQRFQQREGWPGHELSTRGVKRAAGIVFGISLLGLDLVALVGLVVDASLRSDLTTALVYLGEFLIVVTWMVLLWWWIRRYQRMVMSRSSG